MGIGVGGTVAAGFAAAKISASVGDAYALLCKESLADTATFALSATITEAGDALATLEAATDRPTLFAVGIATAEE